MRGNNAAVTMPNDVRHDRISGSLEREVKNLHGFLRRRHRANFIGRGILDRIIEVCLEEIWSTDLPMAFDPPLEDFESKWAAALLISESAKQILIELRPYSERYVESARWFLKPWVIVESIVCERAIQYVLDDMADLYEELKGKGELHARGQAEP